MTTIYPHISLGILQKADSFGKFTLHLDSDTCIINIQTRKEAEEIKNEFITPNGVYTWSN